MGVENNNNKNLLDFGLSMFDKLTNVKDGKSRIWNIIVMLIIFFIGFTVYQWEELKSLYKETRFETYQETINYSRHNTFLGIAQQQLQILYVNSKADLTLVYEYYPPNQHFFYNAIFFEGTLPDGVRNLDELKSVPIDKTAREYRIHVSGLPYTSSDTFDFFPHEFQKELGFVFSCPIFNLDNVYSGNISMIWLENPEFNEERLETLQSMCFQSSRVIGRAK